MSDEWDARAARLGIKLEPWQKDIIRKVSSDDPMCLMCDEPVWGDAAQDPVWTEDGARTVHWQCMLREVIGGIGHLVAHDHWCGAPRHDPDAGLTYRQSALLVAAWVRIVGTERVDEEADDE